jgi:diguanylate cyclase (GGDEF)-like protein
LDKKVELPNRDNFDLKQLIRGLNTLGDSNRKPGGIFELIVQQVYAAVNCEHVFLSRYDSTAKMFNALAWRSSVNPGDVSLEQKFMGSSYFSGQAIVVNDLSQYNYRLRPGVARLGFLSMAGIPLMTRQGLAGVLEVFSETADNFSDLDIELLTLFANQAMAAMEKADAVRECSYWSAENDFLLAALKLEQASVGSLLYKVGETFSSLLSVDGIAIFGVEAELAENQLQEVTAKGFSMPDIGRLKTLYNKEYLERLVKMADTGDEQLIVKQTLKNLGPGGAKLLYTVPIIYKGVLYGIIVFYWTQINKEVDMAGLERFIKRIISDMTVVLGRKHLYSNIQRISFSDILTGLANRRLFDYVLDRELKKSKRSGKPLSLLMVDVDFFKSINDTFGHLMGDAILEQVGAILKETFRNIDLPARYGGEEFAVVLPETDRENAIAAAERLRDRVAKHQFHIGNQYIGVTVSVGAATYNKKLSQGAGDAESIILAADQALYQAKQLGRNITIFAGNY